MMRKIWFSVDAYLELHNKAVAMPEDASILVAPVLFHVRLPRSCLSEGCFLGGALDDARPLA